jgi:cell division protein FtsX
MAINFMEAFTHEPPELDFIWPGFLAGTVGALVAPGATGKSYWALEAAMALACSVAGGDVLV